MKTKLLLSTGVMFGLLSSVFAASTASAASCTTVRGQQICASSPAALARVTGTSVSQAQAAANQFNAQQAAAKAQAQREADARAASYAAAQRQAALIAQQNKEREAALKAAQQKERDRIAMQELAAKTAAQKAAAAKAAAEAQARQLAAQAQLNYRTNLNNQVATQLTQSGAACSGYWQSGRCVSNGYVAYNGGSPVNVMNQPSSTWAGAGKRQTCTLVYKYVGGRVVGSPQSVCTIS
jgi:hypothetical protein